MRTAIQGGWVIVWQEEQQLATKFLQAATLLSEASSALCLGMLNPVQLRHLLDTPKPSADPDPPVQTHGQTPPRPQLCQHHVFWVRDVARRCPDLVLEDIFDPRALERVQAEPESALLN